MLKAVLGCLGPGSYGLSSVIEPPDQPPGNCWECWAGSIPADAPPDLFTTAVSSRPRSRPIPFWARTPRVDPELNTARMPSGCSTLHTAQDIAERTELPLRCEESACRRHRRRNGVETPPILSTDTITDVADPSNPRPCDPVEDEKEGERRAIEARARDDSGTDVVHFSRRIVRPRDVGASQYDWRCLGPACRSGFPQIERHKDAVRVKTIAKRRALDKAVLSVKCPRPKIMLVTPG
jgi:hypothetical protein